MLKPGSLLAIGPETNKKWFHSIPKLEEDISPRISLSFRVIDTFIDADETIVGKGKEYQRLHYPFEKNFIESGFTKEHMEKMIQIEKDALEKLNTLLILKN